MFYLAEAMNERCCWLGLGVYSGRDIESIE